jgi:predicted AAA+ superfamily ATPase
MPRPAYWVPAISTPKKGRSFFLRTSLFGGFAQTKPSSSSRSLSERIVRGGYPEAVSRPDPGRRSAWFASYLSTLLQREVRDLARVDGLVALPNLLKLLAARDCSTSPAWLGMWPCPIPP